MQAKEVLVEQDYLQEEMAVANLNLLEHLAVVLLEVQVVHLLAQETTLVAEEVLTEEAAVVLALEMVDKLVLDTVLAVQLY
jgi:hypothetical protein